MNSKAKILERVSHFKESAVMILIDEHGRLILTKRTRLVKSHRGQFSFPGGKKEGKDKTLLETALRETEEEIGISRNQIKNIIQLDSYFSPRGFLIQAFLGRVEGRVQFHKSKDEVARIVRVPIKFFQKNKPLFRVYNIKGIRIRADFYLFGPHIIWGATARMISILKKSYIR